MTKIEFIEHVAAESAKIGSAKKAAKAWGMSQQYLCAILTGGRTPGPKVLRALGYEVVVDYRKKRTAAGCPDGDNV